MGYLMRSLRRFYDALHDVVVKTWLWLVRPFRRNKPLVWKDCGSVTCVSERTANLVADPLWPHPSEQFVRPTLSWQQEAWEAYLRDYPRLSGFVPLRASGPDPRKNEYMRRIGEHDPAELNEIAGLIIDGSTRHPLLSDRYGPAVAILESDWLKQKIERAKSEATAELLAAAEDAAKIDYNEVGEFKQWGTITMPFEIWQSVVDAVESVTLPDQRWGVGPYEPQHKAEPTCVERGCRGFHGDME